MLFRNRSQLFAWSRRPENLIWGAAVILGGSLALHGMQGMLGRGGAEDRLRFRTVEEAVELVRQAPEHWGKDPGVEDGSAPGPEGPELFQNEEDLLEEPGSGAKRDLILAWVEQQVLRRLGEAGLGKEWEILLHAYARGRYGPPPDRPVRRLELERLGEEGREFAWELAGDLAALDLDAGGAERCYRRELDLRPSQRAAGWLLRRAMRQADEGKRASLEMARGQARLWQAAHPHLRLVAAAQLRDWGGMVLAALEMDYRGVRPGVLLVALAAAALWFCILIQFAGFRLGLWPVWGGALLLGSLSATATLCVSVVQETVLRVTLPGDDLATGLVHFVAGVGLREEVLKLAFFLPLLPWLVRRGGARDALAAAGLTGLGFAFMENVGYYQREGGGAVIGRLLTANVLHVALTGTIGLAVYRTVCRRGRAWEEALATFLALVVAHGLYDAFLALPALAGDLSLVSSIILALMAWRYFELAEAHYRPSGVRIPVLAVFVLGTALLVGLTLNVMLAGAPTFPGAVIFLAGTAQLLPTAFVFIHRFRER